MADDEEYPPVPRNLMWDLYAEEAIAYHREREAAIARSGSLRGGTRFAKVAARRRRPDPEEPT